MDNQKRNSLAAIGALLSATIPHAMGVKLPSLRRRGNKYPREPYPQCVPPPKPNSKPRPVARFEFETLSEHCRLLNLAPRRKDGNKLGNRARKILAGIAAQ